MPQSPRSVTVKKRWRGRKETAKVMAMQESTKVIRLFLFLSLSCLLHIGYRTDFTKVEIILKGRPPPKKNVFFRALPELPLSPYKYQL